MTASKAMAIGQNGVAMQGGRLSASRAAAWAADETALSAHYVRWVGKKSTLLTGEQERALAAAIRQGNPAAKEALIQANLRLVLSVARQFSAKTRQPEFFMDLVQEGNLGLIKAVEKFDPSKGNRFSTYAMWWIKQCIYQAAADHERPMRLPAHVLDSLNKYKRAKDTLAERLGRPATDAELAEAMKLSLKKVMQLGRISQKALSLELETTLKDGNKQTLGDTLEDERAVTEQALDEADTLASLRQAMDELLSEREREVLTLRFGLGAPEPQKMTLEEVGARFGVTRECIRQMELRALKKLRHSAYLSGVSIQTA